MARDPRVLNAICVLKTIITQAEAGSYLAGRAAIDAANVVDAIGRAVLGRNRRSATQKEEVDRV